MPRLLQTPHPVYGLSWSKDSSRLLFGGGYLYGQGFIGLTDDQAAPLRFVEEPELLAAAGLDDSAGWAPHRVVSNVLLSDDGASAALTLAGYKWHRAAPLVVSLPELGLMCHPDLEALDPEDHISGTPIGSWPHATRLLTFYRRRAAEGSVIPFTLPAPFAAAPERGALQDARMAVIDDVAWVARPETRAYSQRGTGPPMVPGSDLRLIENPPELVAVDLRAPEAAPTCLPLPRDARPNSLVRSLDGALLHVAMRDGHVHSYRRIGRVEVAPLRVLAHEPGVGGAPIVVRGVLSLCGLPDGETLVTAGDRGRLCFWRGERLVARWDLPRPWSPRSLAASPDGRRLAVGCKQRSGVDPGAVVILDLREVAGLT